MNSITTAPAAEILNHPFAMMIPPLNIALVCRAFN